MLTKTERSLVPSSQPSESSIRDERYMTSGTNDTSFFSPPFTNRFFLGGAGDKLEFTAIDNWHLIASHFSCGTIPTRSKLERGVQTHLQFWVWEYTILVAGLKEKHKVPKTSLNRELGPENARFHIGMPSGDLPERLTSRVNKSSDTVLHSQNTQLFYCIHCLGCK